MKIDPKTVLDDCETLMLDMDGTVLDLAYDNYMWLQHVPRKFAAENGLEPADARDQLLSKFREMQGRLEWYCLDHWSEILGIDILQLHREEHHRIAYLPGAEAFLREMRDREVRVLMVTNSYQGTLDLKDEVTSITAHFDGIYSSHDFGYPKEQAGFWQELQTIEGFDPQTTVFVDDTVRVLRSAADYGVSMLLEITHPDTSAPPREGSEYTGVSGLRDLL